MRAASNLNPRYLSRYFCSHVQIGWRNSLMIAQLATEEVAANVHRRNVPRTRFRETWRELRDIARIIFYFRVT